ncbi:hypothetical protein XENTR_v10001532 [Xenopus tropicalis]|uniref:Hexosyltransferase n=2 Tax=Xenopus tropicalis TaxID=8364 RepID=A0A8J0S5Z2_XENTR|nr:N-acetyllactosaminide beta-1,3-N-acetylglucosaminyltransferase 3 isoform X1 [Xenopus tropicalis]KAE8632382.1 hypothetical protein XENTR_v10001532 [Xenopus tropicalis]|eukprot:XP_012809210.1 PREDICTED: N-acetyllactosaminide beta-1,3-N-acetylglucosaminyltransferase 3 isoform X2 [Xenopus tropicalis]
MLLQEICVNMRRKFFKTEIFVLLAVGIPSLLFILWEDQNNQLVLEEIEEPSPERLADNNTIDSPAVKIEWKSSCKANYSVENISGFSDLPPHIKDFLIYRHCRSFPIIIDAPSKCGGPSASKGVFLLLAIKSSPGNYERRAVIRQTWGAEETYGTAKVRRIFISGISKANMEVKRMNKLLKIESQKFGDILQWDFQDTFFNLTLKQLLFHQWLDENCPGANFIFNGDDDVFVNTFNVIAFSQGLGEHGADKHLYVGQLIANVGPIRESQSKYYVPVQVTTSDSYPRYCGGGGILMSRFTCLSISNQSKSIELFPIDDVYLGMCLEKAGLVPASHMGMRTVGVKVPSDTLDSFDPCYYRELLMVHRFVPYEMIVMWNAIQDSKLDCGQKHAIYIGV